MEIKLFWKPDLANAFLVAEKQPRREQPVFARVYIDNDHEGFKGWCAQIYVSTLWPSGQTVLDERPVGHGLSKHASFKHGRKRAEEIIVRWFKGLGITATVEKPEFEKEELWAIEAQE